MIAQIIDVFAFWDVLPDQTIGIFVEAPLPGVIRVSEEPFGLQVVENLFMVSEFSAIVVSQGEDAILIGFQVVTDRLRNSLRCFIGGLDSNAKSRFTLNKTLVAPTLIELGVQPLSAHLFVLYFGMMSMITPLVAIAAFTASVIAKAKPVATSVQAIRLGWAAYVVPFIFIYGLAILMNDTNFEIVIASLRAGLGVWVISGCLVGQLFGRLGPVRRSVFALAGLTALIPSPLLPVDNWAAIASLFATFFVIVFDFLTSRARTSNTWKRFIVPGSRLRRLRKGFTTDN